MKDLQTYISRQTEGDTDGLILYFLKNVKRGVREMYIDHTAIFKDRPNVRLVKS